MGGCLSDCCQPFSRKLYRAGDVHPERYLEKDGERFRGDNRAVVQPFSLGPRNCIGQNLAKAEMRLILAKLVWHFDMELVDKDEDWVSKQHVYGLWDKEPLMVKLVSARAPRNQEAVKTVYVLRQAQGQGGDAIDDYPMLLSSMSIV